MTRYKLSTLMMLIAFVSVCLAGVRSTVEPVQFMGVDMCQTRRVILFGREIIWINWDDRGGNVVTSMDFPIWRYKKLGSWGEW